MSIPPMILVDGIGRSGTSLLGRLLSMVLEPVGYVYYFEPLQHPSPAGTYAKWREIIGEVWSAEDEQAEFAQYIANMQRTAGEKLLWKEIRLALKQDWLLAHFPQMKIVHLTRDILGVWSSHRRDGAPEWMARHREMWCEAARRWMSEEKKLARKGIAPPTGADQLDASDEIGWYSLMWAINEAFVASLHHERLMRVGYENLCTEPMEIMTEIANFLEAPINESMRAAILKHVAEELSPKDPSGGAGGPAEKMPEIWRERLGAEEIAAVLRVAGVVRQKLGYPAAALEARPS